MTVLVFMAIAFTASLWMVGPSVSAMGVSADLPGGAKLTNGFWNRDPDRACHVVLWMVVASFFSATMVAVKGLVGGES